MKIIKLSSNDYRTIEQKSQKSRVVKDGIPNKFLSSNSKIKEAGFLDFLTKKPENNTNTTDRWDVWKKWKGSKREHNDNVVFIEEIFDLIRFNPLLILPQNKNFERDKNLILNALSGVKINDKMSAYMVAEKINSILSMSRKTSSVKTIKLSSNDCGGFKPPKGHLDTQMFPECKDTECDRDIVKKTVEKRKNRNKKASHSITLAQETIDDEDSHQRFSFGETPEEIIKERVTKQTPGGYSMHIKNQNEWSVIAKAVNQGIDSHLEGFSRSTFDNKTGNCLIHPEEMTTFLRRLAESSDEEAWSLRMDILSTLGIEEV